MQVNGVETQECLEKSFQCKPKAAQCVSAFSSKREAGEGQTFLLWMETCYSCVFTFSLETTISKAIFCLPFPTQLASNSCSVPHHSQEGFLGDFEDIALLHQCVIGK